MVRPFVIQTDIDDIYDFSECIGAGASGNVFLSVDKKLKKKAAIKAMKIDRSTYNSDN